MNLVCVGVEILMINTYGNVIFGFDHVPSWANSTSIGSWTNVFSINYLFHKLCKKKKRFKKT